MKKAVTFWGVNGTKYVDNYTFFGKKEAKVKGLLWASERLIWGGKKKIVEYPGNSGYNSLAFLGTFHTTK